MSDSLHLDSDIEDDVSGGSRPIAQASSAAGFLTVLRNRPFLALWAAQATSQTATNALWYALIIMVAQATGQTPALVGLTIILVQLPTVLFSSPSGVFVDRFSKKAILIGTNVIRVVSVLLYVFLQHTIIGLYLVTFFTGVVSQPFAPAEGSTIPLLVEGEELITANSLFQITLMGSQGVGYAIAPIAIGLLGMSTTLVVLACLFGLAAIFLVSLPPITTRHLPTTGLDVRAIAVRMKHDLGEVLHFIIDDPPLALALFQIALAPTLLLVLAEVGPDFLTHSLGIGQTSTSLFFLLAPAGAGVGIGMFILGHWGSRLRKDRLVLVALIALGVTVIGLASVPVLGSFWVHLDQAGIHIPVGLRLTATMAPIAALMGMEVAFINAPVQTIVQERAAPELRGRVLAMQQTLSAAMAIPPLIFVGAIAAIIGTPATLSITGLVIVAVGLTIVYYA